MEEFESTSKKPLREVLMNLTEGDEEFLSELSVAYLENVEEFKVKAREAIEEGDQQVLKDVIHKVKPSLITMERTQLLEYMQKQAEVFDASEKEKHLEMIDSACDALIVELRELA